jgi:hypothetical protein
MAQANNVNATKIITHKELETIPQGSLVVVADDFAGTGNSLKNSLSLLKLKRDDIHACGTAIVTTKKAELKLSSLQNETSETGFSTSFFGYETIEGPLQNFNMNFLSSRQSAFAKKLYKGGYGSINHDTHKDSGGLGVMSVLTGIPDNNANFYSHDVFVQKIAHGNSKGSYSPIKPDHNEIVTIKESLLLLTPKQAGISIGAGAGFGLALLNKLDKNESENK